MVGNLSVHLLLDLPINYYSNQNTNAGYNQDQCQPCDHTWRPDFHRKQSLQAPSYNNSQHFSVHENKYHHQKQNTPLHNFVKIYLGHNVRHWLLF